jgi:hypothetical protein
MYCRTGAKPESADAEALPGRCRKTNTDSERMTEIQVEFRKRRRNMAVESFGD